MREVPGSIPGAARFIANPTRSIIMLYSLLLSSFQQTLPHMTELQPHHFQFAKQPIFFAIPTPKFIMPHSLLLASPQHLLPHAPDHHHTIYITLHDLLQHSNALTFLVDTVSCISMSWLQHIIDTDTAINTITQKPHVQKPMPCLDASGTADATKAT